MPKVATDASGRIIAAAQKAEEKAAPVAGALALLDKGAGEIAKCLPRNIQPDRFRRIVFTAVRQTPELALTTPESFMGCVMQLAALGLEPNTPLGYAWLIPRNNTRARVLETTIQIGYKGYVELCSRGGVSLIAHVVREGDRFEWAYGLKDFLVHEPSGDGDRESRPIVAAWAKAVGYDAPPVFRVLSFAQLEFRRMRSQRPNSGPWLEFREAMYAKTAARALEPWIPKNPDLARAAWIEDNGERGRRSTEALAPDVCDALQRIGLDPEKEVENIAPDKAAEIVRAGDDAVLDMMDPGAGGGQ